MAEHKGDFLVTGVSSGLGKHCAEYYHAVHYSRTASFPEIMQQARARPFRAIIHAAFNTKHDINESSLYSYLNDTTLLTQKLLQVPHEKFIFISTADVYPKNGELHVESEEINLKDISNLYAISKLISESMVQNETPNHLILRSTALLGQYARQNSLIKILTQDKVDLTLSAQSTFNYILHSDVSDFIDKALAQNLTGTYNLAAYSNLTLGDVSREYERKVNFGNYTYQTGNIANQKVIDVLDNFKKTSSENVRLFLKNYQICV